MFEKCIDCVLATFNRQPGFRDRLERLFESAIKEHNGFGPILIGLDLKIGVFCF